MRCYIHLGHGCFKFGNVIGQNEGDYFQWSPPFFNSHSRFSIVKLQLFFKAERVASVYICTRKHGIIRFLYKIYVLIQVNMSVYWPYPKQASDCVQRDIWYLVNPRACSRALAALGTLQPTPSGLLNTIDPWMQSLTYIIDIIDTYVSIISMPIYSN